MASVICEGTVLAECWQSTIAPRRCAKRGRREACRRRSRLHAQRRASNLRSRGQSTRALPVCYANDVKYNRHSTHHFTLPGTYGEPTTAANQEQYAACRAGAGASMVRDGPRGRRSATRGRAPVHFQVCSPYTYLPPKPKPPPVGRAGGDSGRSVPLYPPWGSNPRLRDGRGACCPLYDDKIQQLGTVPLSHTARLLSQCNTKTLATALDTPCGPPLMASPLPPPGPVGTGAVGGVPAGPGWLPSARSFPATPI